MYKKMIKLIIIFLLTLVPLVDITPPLAMEVMKNNITWSQSYEDIRKNMKPLSPSEKSKCEKLLRELLNDLDTKNSCNSDRDCSLIDQEPFGATVPILTKDADDVIKKMKTYSDKCDNGSFHVVRDKELENIPVCWKHKCMVKTGFKNK